MFENNPKLKCLIENTVLPNFVTRASEELQIQFSEHPHAVEIYEAITFDYDICPGKIRIEQFYEEVLVYLYGPSVVLRNLMEYVESDSFQQGMIDVSALSINRSRADIAPFVLMVCDDELDFEKLARVAPLIRKLSRVVVFGSVFKCWHVAFKELVPWWNETDCYFPKSKEEFFKLCDQYQVKIEDLEKPLLDPSNNVLVFFEPKDGYYAYEILERDNGAPRKAFLNPKHEVMFEEALLNYKDVLDRLA